MIVHEAGWTGVLNIGGDGSVINHVKWEMFLKYAVCGVRQAVG